MGSDIRIKLVTSIADDLRILPQFLSYYSERGAEEFLVVVTDQKGDGQIIEEAKKLLEPYRHAIVGTHVGKSNWVSQTRMIHEAIRDFCYEDDWVLLPDVDELHEYPDQLERFLVQSEAQGINVVTGEFVDRVTHDGSLPELKPDTPLFEQFPLGCRIGVNILEVPRTRTVAIKGGLNVSKHFATFDDDYLMDLVEKKSAVLHPKAMVKVHHFKWHSRVLREYNRRLQHYISLHKAGDKRFTLFRESERLLKFLAEHDGHIDINDERLETVNIYDQKRQSSRSA